MSLDGECCPFCTSDNTVETWDGSDGSPAEVGCVECGYEWEAGA